jgi:hypothetical protein
MAQQPIKLHVTIGRDHTVKLPDDVPEGPAELIVLVAGAPAAAGSEGLIGMMSDEPEIMDAVMEHARTLRRRLRVRPDA